MDQGVESIERQARTLRGMIRELRSMPSIHGGAAQRNEQHLTLNAGHWITHLFVTICFACAAVTTALYVTSKADWNAQRTDMRNQARADRAQLQAEIRELRSQIETQQAYINVLMQRRKK